METVHGQHKMRYYDFAVMCSFLLVSYQMYVNIFLAVSR